MRAKRILPTIVEIIYRGVGKIFTQCAVTAWFAFGHQHEMSGTFYIQNEKIYTAG